MVAKTSIPSRKNGRFSGKKVSKVDRFRMTVSASTWPKSGLIVRSSVSSLVRCALASRPAEACAKRPMLDGVGVGAGRAVLELAEHEGAQLEAVRRRQAHQIVEPAEQADEVGGADAG